MQIGWQLCSASDAQTQAQLSTELRLLQEDWERTESLLGKRRALTEAILQVHGKGHGKVTMADAWLGLFGLTAQS